MTTPGEHKTVQSRILAYAEAIGWTVVPRPQAEQRRGFAPTSSSTESATSTALYFADLLEAKVREFNPRYSDEPGALLRSLRRFQATIHGNRDFVELLRNRGTFVDQAEQTRTRPDPDRLRRHLPASGSLAQRLRSHRRVGLSQRPLRHP